MQLIWNHMIIIPYGIATFSNRTLKFLLFWKPLKCNKLQNDQWIKNHTTLGLIEWITWLQAEMNIHSLDKFLHDAV